MHVLVTCGSRRGGTEGIASQLGQALRAAGLDVTVSAARQVRTLHGFDAVLVGGALYMGRWHGDSRRFVNRHLRTLRRLPVWLFSSGPLDASAATTEVPPVRDVSVLMQTIGAQGHATFGGRLLPDVKGFPASAMAKDRAGDWRDATQIERWASTIAQQLPTARPRVPLRPAGSSALRLIAHAGFGAAAALALKAGLLAFAPAWVALAVHAVGAPALFAGVAVLYFRAPGRWEALPVALLFAATLVASDLVQGAGHLGLWATWVPAVFVLLVTWAIGSVLAMMPDPAPSMRPSGA